MERRINQRSQQTRESILDAALNNFAHKGYHDTRMDDIVTEAGSSKGVVYFHFPGKEYLFLTLVDEFASRLAKLLLVQAVGLGQTFESKRIQILDKFAHLIKTHLDEAMVDGDIPPLDSEITSYAWIGAINELIMRWIQSGEPTPERIAPALRTLLLHSIQFDIEKNL